MCQSKIPLGLGHVASIKVQRRKTIIAGKELLRLACFPRHLNCLIVAAGGEFPLEMALIYFPAYSQSHGEILALIQRTDEVERRFGRPHGPLGTSAPVGGR